MKNHLLFLTAFLFLSLSLSAQIKMIKPLGGSSAGTAAGTGFSAYNSTELPMSVSGTKESVIVFDKEHFDDANAFNGAAFKAPSDGVYQFVLNIGLSAVNKSSSTEQILCKIKTANEAVNQLLNIPANYDNTITQNIVAIMKLKAGEEVSVVLYALGSNTSAKTSGNLSKFSGVKLY